MSLAFALFSKALKSVMPSGTQDDAAIQTERRFSDAARGQPPSPAMQQRSASRPVTATAPLRAREGAEPTQRRSYASATSERQQQPYVGARQQQPQNHRSQNHHNSDGRRTSLTGNRTLHASCSAELGRLRQELVDTRTDFEQRLAAEQRRAEAEKADAIQYIEHLRAKLQELEGHKHGMQTALRAEHDRATRAQAECKDMRQLFDARTAELASAQAFMAPADALSERDVANQVEALNEEIFQLSSLLAEDVRFVAPDERSATAQASVSKRIGAAICGMLTSNDEGARLTALQLALQATASRWVEKRLDRWSCIDSELKARAEEMYETILRTEKLVVAKRWRVVTLKSILESENKSLNELSASLRGALITVFLASGCVPREEEKNANMLQAFSENIQSVASLFLQLRYDINVGVTSSELVTYVPRPDSQYDSNSMEAEDAGQQHEGGSVGCGLTLGLMRVSEGSNGHTLVKPKVIHAASFAAAA